MGFVMVRGINVSHPTGNANVRQLLGALSEVGIDWDFWTSIDLSRINSVFNDLGLEGLRAQAEKRTFERVGRSRVHSRPWSEARRLLARRIPQLHQVLGSVSPHSLYAGHDRWVANRLREVSVSVAFEDAARDTFVRTSAENGVCVYDLPIPHWQMKHKLLEQERERRPAWGGSLGIDASSPQVLERKDAELASADVVFAASPLTARSVKASGLFRGSQLHMIPYGCPPARGVPSYSLGGPLKLLYVGSLTQRKGLADVLEAVEFLGAGVILTVVGRPPAEFSVPHPVSEKVKWIGALPPDRILDVMRSSDLLLLPSLVEGFGLVLTEALSQGTPIVCTPATGGPLLLKDHPDAGFIVEPGSASALIQVFEVLLRDIDLRNYMKDCALKAAAAQPWSSYRAQVASIIQSLI